LAGALCRAYNRWLADYCRPYPDRLFGIAMLPLQSIDHAIDEMRFARKELGFRGGFIRPNPYNNRMLHDPAYEPLWSAAEELDFSIGIHEGGNSGMPTVGIDRFKGRGAQHIISHTMEMMLACMSMIWGGVCERHPKLRVGILESGGGWMAPWLDRMDRHFDDQGFNDSGLKTRPSELFQRNCWISFEPVEGSIKVLAEYIGPKKILWATDYPHRDGFFPGAPQMIRDRLAGASPEHASGHGRWCYGVLWPQLTGPPRRTRFPVFPIEPGISSIFPTELPFDWENIEANQPLADQFPVVPLIGKLDGLIGN
jgi:predicted TIM-barrel fold metal-dependent hydrolase